MKSILAILFLVLSIPMVAPARPAHAASAPRILYRSNWSSGLAGWTARGEAKWTASGGTATCTATGNRSGELLAPFIVPAGQAFAIEAQIEQLDTGGSAGYARGYGVIAGSNGKNLSGIDGGFFYGSTPDDAQSGLFWNNASYPGDDVALHDGYNTFRLEVRGSAYTLRENGTTALKLTIGSHAGTRVGVFCRSYSVRVRSLTIVALPSGGGSAGPALPPLAALNLQPADVPLGYARTFAGYATNNVVARSRQVSIASVDATGRVLGYDLDYGRSVAGGQIFLLGSVALYRDAASSRAYFEGLVARDKALAQQVGYSEYSGSVPGRFGEDDYASSYTLSLYGLNEFREYQVYFRRGPYLDTAGVSFPAGTFTDAQANSLLTSLAQALDARLKAATNG